jgi:hypothetical protein
MTRMITLLAGTLVVPWIASCLPPGGEDFGGGPGVDFRLNELEAVGLSEEQMSRLYELDNHYQAEMASTFRRFEEMSRYRRPTPDEIGEMESEMNLLLDDAWFHLRSVLTEEQLARLTAGDPTHPLARGEAPRFTAPPMDAGPRGGGPGNRGGW